MAARVGLRAAGVLRSGLVYESFGIRCARAPQSAPLSTLSQLKLSSTSAHDGRVKPLSSSLSSPFHRRVQMRHKSVFQHRWFHPESKQGEPPKQSYRVFWTVTFVLGAFSAAYIKWIDPYLTHQAEMAALAQAAASASNEPVFDKDNFLTFEIKRIEPYNQNTKLSVC